jgi:hypothetical protein
VVLRELTAVRRLPEVLLGVALLTLASGASLLWVASGGLLISQKRIADFGPVLENDATSDSVAEVGPGRKRHVFN